MAGGHEAEEKKAEEEKNEGGVEADFDSGEAEESEGDDEVKEAPEEIHDGVGVAAAWRPRERAGEWLAAQSANEVRDGVAQERAGEEVGHEA